MDSSVNTVGSSSSLPDLVQEFDTLQSRDLTQLSQIEKKYTLDRSRKAIYISSVVCAASICFATALPATVLAVVWAQHTIVVFTTFGKMYFAKKEIRKKVQEQWELFLEKDQGQVGGDKIQAMKETWETESKWEGNPNESSFFSVLSIVLLADVSAGLHLAVAPFAGPFAFLAISGILGSLEWLGFHVFFLHSDIKRFENYVNVGNQRFEILSRINQVLTEEKVSLAALAKELEELQSGGAPQIEGQYSLDKSELETGFSNALASSMLLELGIVFAAAFPVAMQISFLITYVFYAICIQGYLHVKENRIENKDREYREALAHMPEFDTTLESVQKKCQFLHDLNEDREEIERIQNQFSSMNPVSIPNSSRPPLGEHYFIRFSNVTMIGLMNWLARKAIFTPSVLKYLCPAFGTILLVSDVYTTYSYVKSFEKYAIDKQEEHKLIISQITNLELLSRIDRVLTEKIQESASSDSGPGNTLHLYPGTAAYEYDIARRGLDVGFTV